MVRSQLLSVLLVLACAAAAVGGFMAGHKGGPSLRTERQLGVVAGARAGAHVGGWFGYRAGYRVGYRAGYERTYRVAYQRAAGR